MQKRKEIEDKAASAAPSNIEKPVGNHTNATIETPPADLPSPLIPEPIPREPAPSPILEEPNESRIQSPELQPNETVDIPSRPATPIPPESPSPPPAAIPKIITPSPPPAEAGKSSPTPKAASDEDSEAPAIASSLTPGRGKSKITGKDLSGWI